MDSGETGMAAVAGTVPERGMVAEPCGGFPMAVSA